MLLGEIAGWNAEPAERERDALFLERGLDQGLEDSLDIFDIARVEVLVRFAAAREHQPGAKAECHVLQVDVQADAFGSELDGLSFVIRFDHRDADGLTGGNQLRKLSVEFLLSCLSLFRVFCHLLL